MAKQFGRLTDKDTLNPNFIQTFGYLFDQDRILIGQAGDGTQTLFFDGRGIDEHLGQVTASSAKGYETDYLGSVLNGAAGGPGNEFGAFGELMGATPGFSKTSDPVQYGFAGRQYDAENNRGNVGGLYYDRNRMYSPALGRFLSSDPIGFRGGINPYVYTGNNPVNFVDPMGLYGVAVPIPGWFPAFAQVPVTVFPGSGLQWPQNSSSSSNLLSQLGQIYRQVDQLQQQQQSLQQQLGGANQCNGQSESAEQLQLQLNQNLQQQNQLFNQFINTLNPFNSSKPAPPPQFQI